MAVSTDCSKESRVSRLKDSTVPRHFPLPPGCNGAVPWLVLVSTARATAGPEAFYRLGWQARHTRSAFVPQQWRIMSILVRFTGAPSVTTEKYDEVNRRLESQGDYPPDGLEYHVAFNSGGNFRVSEIWDSQEKFQAFGERLMPILDEVGIELAGEPEVLEIHNIIKR
jgi:hypothetical protein